MQKGGSPPASAGQVSVVTAANAQQTRLDQLEKQMETRAAEQKITNDLQLKLLQSLNDKIQPVQNTAPAPAPDGNDILQRMLTNSGGGS
jgi:hypothetical protein